MRPKSSATVVWVLPSTPVTSSTPTLASVRISSVVSGGISLTAPTSVVLPVPKPPATTILTDVRSIVLSPPLSEPLEAGQNRVQQAKVDDPVLRRRTDAEIALL